MNDNKEWSVKMKKRLLLSLIIIGVLFLAGCQFSLTTESTQTTTFLTYATTTTTREQTTASIDVDQLMEDVYQRIYEELYNEVRLEVIQNISEERFNQIYDQIIVDLLNKIQLGEIEVSALSVIDMVYAVVEQEAKAVVGVSNLDSSGNLSSLGSGVIYKRVGSTYYVVSNQHVVDGGASFEIRFADGSTIPATLVGVDSLVDVSVLRFVSAEDLPVASFGDSDNQPQGTFVLAVGNPSGYEYFGSVNFGIVSGTSRYFDIDGNDVKDMFVGYIQHDASINQGNSGGPLFNLNGEIIGINVIKIADISVEGMGFAIPGNLVKDICADIEEFGYSLQKPVLGIEFVSILGNEDYFTFYNIAIPESITAGFYINSTVAGATLDGLVLPGDIILQIGDVVITNTADFVLGFSKYRVGDVIDLTLYRMSTGETINLTDITLKAKVDE